VSSFQSSTINNQSSTIITFHEVSYCYPRQDQPVLNGISFALRQGEFLGILGADETGKTTLAKLIKGLLLPSRGRICFDWPHASVTASPSGTTDELREARRAVGVIFSDPENQIVGTTVEEDVAFGLENLQIAPRDMRIRIERVLEQVGLLSAAKRAPHTLSGGEQQKLCIAGVLAMEPECLVLDNPLSFLDRQSRNELLQLFNTLNAAGKTLVYLTSDPDEVVGADRVLMLAGGTIGGEYAPENLWEKPDILEQAGILPSDMMRFRSALIQKGLSIAPDAMTPEMLACEIIRHCRK